MADRIKLLPEVVANQIAAGEVVEEPASVVKEMMENAIDAGARCVKVLFRNGGLDLIQIIDDGCGMSPTDARSAFDRHATSKIASVEDIYALRTFGFRGEALASIAAVSQVELKTRQSDSETGTETLISGGEFISQKPVMTPVGSNFMVKNLFYNVPARRKFLREPSRLASAVKAEFQRVVLCYPDLEFELHSNGSVIYNLRAAALPTRIIDVIGNHIKKNLLEVDADTSIVRINGYVGRPAVAKKRNNEQYLFVNGRYFKSPYLNKAILKAYEKLIPEGSYPSYFIYITVDPERIDVNVSPKKTEVKFADTEPVWQILNAAVRETLAKTGAVPMIDFDNESDIEIPVSQRGVIYQEPRSAVNENYNPFLETDDDDNLRETAMPMRQSAMPGFRRETSVNAGYGLTPNNEFAIGHMHSNIAEEEFEEFVSGNNEYTAEFSMQDIPSFGNPDVKPEIRSAVYLGGGYAAALVNNRLAVIDLRRAKERILYENYLLLLSGTSSVSQQLLFPEKLVLSNDEYSLLQENAAEFSALGFEISFEGDGSVSVTGIPAETGNENIDELIFELLKVFDMPVSAVEIRRQSIARAMARSGASRAPRNMSDEEVSALLDNLLQSDNISYSPSGKPIMAEITADEIRAKLA
ncbi:MAG: DNA mismatch repair endonuclease MutL [Alistipes sp.]|nr:DNA mismatch repair endonuclease MutL [Alistipes sp.]